MIKKFSLYTRRCQAGRKVYRKSEWLSIHELINIEDAEISTARQELRHDLSSSNIQEFVLVVMRINYFNYLWCFCWPCWTQHSWYCLLLRFENVRWQEIAMTPSMIYDLTFVTVNVKRMFREIAVRIKWIKIFCSWVNTVKL